MASPLVAQFCTEVNTALRHGDGGKLQAILVLEPPYTPIYQQLIEELRAQYPAADEASEARLEDFVRATVTETAESEDADGRPVQNWVAMAAFLAGWMAFIRDVDISQLLKAYEAMSDLQQRANSALQHPTKGLIVLPTLISYAYIFARVAVGLDRQPELVQYLAAGATTDDDRVESLAEKAANIIRQGFIICLNDKTTVPGGIKNGEPDGKKVGVYKLANVCLKILFQTHKLDNCPMIFKNIGTSSPPLHFYPRPQRVTYLYYLGRYHFFKDEFYQAQLVLQKAYDESPQHASCLRHRRLILVYLLTANLFLGRFPTGNIYSRPEAYDLRLIFQPIIEAIRKGDLEAFRRITNLDLTYEYHAKLNGWQIFYQIRKYCEILVWRSLFRKIFLLAGQQGATERSAPTMDLHAVLIAASHLEKRARMPLAMAQADGGPGRRHISFALHDFTQTQTYVHPDFEGLKLKPYVHEPSIWEMECICASLIMQNYVNGYISHDKKKLAVMGTRKTGSAVKAGFPNAWQANEKKNKEAGKDDVQGWVREMGRPGAPNVVRLEGAKAAGE